MMNTQNQKPVILLVHGAWHPPHLYDDQFRTPVQAHGTHEYTSVRLPSLGRLDDDPVRGVTHAEDAEAILAKAKPFFDQGREVVLVAHSYGGIPSAIATRGQGLVERAAAGKQGGFKSIIFLAAIAVPRAGESVADSYSAVKETPEWQDLERFPMTRDQILTLNNKAIPYLYNDISEEEGKKAFSQLEGLSLGTTLEPVPFVLSDVTLPKTYIICQKDLLLPTAVQEQLVASIPELKVERFDAGHSPFLSRPGDCADLLVEVAGRS